MALLKQFIIALVFFCLRVSCHKITKDQIEASSCYNATLCWNDEDYPTEEIYSELGRVNMENLNTFGHLHKHNTAIISEKDEPSCNLCELEVSIKVFPVKLRAGFDWFYVVRSDKYQQTITINTCKSNDLQENSRCFGLAKILDTTKQCDQKYTLIKLLVYDPNQKNFSEKTTRYPSACVCTIQRT